MERAKQVLQIGVTDCDTLMLSQFCNITYHNCENNHDYIILTIFDEKSIQHVMFYRIKINVFHGLYALGYYILLLNNMQRDYIVNIVVDKHRII